MISARERTRSGRQLIIPVVRDYADVKPKGTAGEDFFSVVTAAPETPGIPRPVWLTIAASVPTGLIWYGWYKYSVEIAFCLGNV